MYKKVPIGRNSKRILQLEFKWGDGAPRLGIYLDVSTRPVLDSRGKKIPLTFAYGKNGFKNENKSIALFGFTDPKEVAKAHGLDFVHLFILNNILTGRGVTDQKKYLDNLRRFSQKNLGLDWTNINESNINTWDTILSALQGKMFTSDWSQWWIDANCFAGPDGDDMSIE